MEKSMPPVVLSFACPHCLSEQTQKISVIWQQQRLQQRPGSFFAFGPLWFVAAATVTHHILASTSSTSSLGPPKPPVKQSNLVVLLMCMISMACLLGTPLGWKNNAILAAVIFGVISIALMVGAILVERKEAPKREKVYAELMHQYNEGYTLWEQAWICHRCDTVYIP